MTEMTARLPLIAPEIVLFIGSVVVAILGLSKARAVREAVPWATIVFLVGAIVATIIVDRTDAVTATASASLLLPELGVYVKILIGLVAIGVVAPPIGIITLCRRRAAHDGSLPQGITPAQSDADQQYQGSNHLRSTRRPAAYRKALS